VQGDPAKNDGGRGTRRRGKKQEAAEDERRPDYRVAGDGDGTNGGRRPAPPVID
jgi:hypothetical protein